jgi:fibronectin-binding autotransporter adhesin
MKRTFFLFCFLGALLACSEGSRVHGAGVVAVCDEPNLRAALAGGGMVTFAASGTIELADTLVITNGTTIDADGYSVTISGSDTVRVLTVNNASTLTLLNLSIANGLAAGSNGPPVTAGGEGRGGGVLLGDGTLIASNCQFLANVARGGNGGSTTNPVSGVGGVGGNAYGGAIEVNGGTLLATNCGFYGNSAKAGNGGNYNSLPYDPNSGLGGHGFGGAIYSSTGAVTLVGCVFHTNQAQGGLAGTYPQSFPGSSTSGAAFGGAICQQGGFVTNLNCQILNNAAFTPDHPLLNNIRSLSGRAIQGGGVFNDGGYLVVAGSTLNSNQVTGGSAAYINSTPGPGQGGAIFNRGTLYLLQSTLRFNSAMGGPFGNQGGDGEGGGLYNAGSAQLDQSWLANNTVEGAAGYYVSSLAGWRPSGSGEGGAIHNTNSLELTACTLSDNLAKGTPGKSGSTANTVAPPSPALGGAIYSRGPCLLTNCTIARNIAEAGSTIYTNFGVNSGGANAFGAGVCNIGGTVFSLNNTIALNEARPGTGLTNGQGFGGGIYSTNAVPLMNTILLHGNSGSNCFTTPLDAGYNLSSDASCNFTGPGSLNSTDPVLGPLANYGGPTRTIPLLGGSPAIDGANPSAFPATDQRGRTRPFGNGPDIGAFESSAPYVIRGTISGVTLSEEVSVSDGSSSVSTADRNYSLEGLSANTYPVTPQSANYLFIPNQQSITVGPDQAGVNFSAYRWNMMSLEEVTNANLRVVYAGTNGHTYRLQTSPDLRVWSTLSTNVIGPSNYSELLLPIGSEPAKFYRTATP